MKVLLFSDIHHDLLALELLMSEPIEVLIGVNVPVVLFPNQPKGRAGHDQVNRLPLAALQVVERVRW
ncbi:MAG TPA: hypothetical protein VEU62_11445 [Bryobacterales bacterium]|nr:hypothetical protein [Bryobacterales bacterium]